jgi:hypothetical protein
MRKTKIKQAAIVSKENDRVYVGKRHNEIISEMVELYGIRPPIDQERFEQGFITNKGEFVDRVEGARIAIESGQIKALKWPPLLYSEDLY